MNAVCDMRRTEVVQHACCTHQKMCEILHTPKIVDITYTQKWATATCYIHTKIVHVLFPQKMCNMLQTPLVAQHVT